MMWTTQNESEEPEWVEPDNLDDDQELDDFQLSRLGIDVPVREWVEPPVVRTPRRQETPNMDELMNVWTAAMGEDHRELFSNALRSVYNVDTGSLEFGDEPEEEEEENTSQWTVGDSAEEVCGECGLIFDDCECPDEYFNNEDYDDDF
jgi:hypothetical protein